MDRRLSLAFLLFMAGIVFAKYFPLPFLSIIAPATALLALLLLPRFISGRPFNIISCALIFLLGSASYINAAHLAPGHIAHLIRKYNNPVYIEGTIVSCPEYIWKQRNLRTGTFLLKATAYEDAGSWHRAEGICIVKIRDNTQDYSYGERLMISGRLKRPSRATNPGEFDYEGFLRQRSIYAAMDVRYDDEIVRFAPRPVRLPGPFMPAGLFKPMRLITGLRIYIEGYIKQHLATEKAGVLNAMLIGRRSYIPPDFKDALVRTGTAHILSVSGLHVAVVAAIVFWLLKLMRISRRPASLILIGFLLIYTCLTGARVPIVRAAIMVTVYLLGYIAQRDFDIYSALSLAGLIILAVNPMQVFDAGFVLSFSCVFWISYLTPKVAAVMGINARKGLSRHILTTLAASVAVYIGVMPLTAHYFNIVSLITVLANIIIVPFSGIIIMSGALFVALGSTLTFLSPISTLLTQAIIGVFMFIIRSLSHVPWAYIYIPDMPVYVMPIYYAAVFMISGSRGVRVALTRVAMILLLSANAFIWHDVLSESQRMRATFLDLKYNNAVFFELPDKTTVLINAGRKRGYYYNEAERIIRPFIWSRGRNRIDILVLTDPTAGSLDAAGYILQRFGVRDIIFTDHETMRLAIDRWKHSIDLGRCDMVVLTPQTDAVLSEDVSLSGSGQAAIRLNYRDISIQFKQTQSSVLIDTRPVLIVTKKFKTGPSAGPFAQNIRTIETRESGAVTMTTDGRGYSVRSFINTSCCAGL